MANLAKSVSVQMAWPFKYSLVDGDKLSYQAVHLFMFLSVFQKFGQRVYLDQHGTTVDISNLKIVAAMPTQPVYV
jgi:hypothetical protein